MLLQMVASSNYGNLQTEQFMNRQAGNINSSVMNNNGYTGNGMPAYQQQQNQKTFNAAVTVISVAAGGVQQQ